jgi:hypothetical protein
VTGVGAENVPAWAHGEDRRRRRGGSAPAMTRARPGQQVARDGPIRSREGVWAVA